MTPFQENEDIQDFLEALEGIIRLQDIDEEEWVLRLTPVLRGKVRAICMDLGHTTAHDEVKKGIRAHVSTRDADPTSGQRKQRN